MFQKRRLAQIQAAALSLLSALAVATSTAESDARVMCALEGKPITNPITSDTCYQHSNCGVTNSCSTHRDWILMLDTETTGSKAPVVSAKAAAVVDGQYDTYCRDCVGNADGTLSATGSFVYYTSTSTVEAKSMTSLSVGSGQTLFIGCAIGGGTASAGKVTTVSWTP